MNFVISTLITITLCVLIEPLKPYWIIVFLVSLGITTGVIEKINEWRIVKRYKAKLEFLEPKIQSVNFQNTLKEINNAKNKFESLKLDTEVGDLQKRHQMEISLIT